MGQQGQQGQTDLFPAQLNVPALEIALKALSILPLFERIVLLAFGFHSTRCRESEDTIGAGRAAIACYHELNWPRKRNIATLPFVTLLSRIPGYQLS